MEIQFKHIENEVPENLKYRATSKLQKLATHLDTPEQEGRVILEIHKSVGSQKSGSIWETTVSAEHVGKTHYASSSGDTAEKATMNAISEMTSEIRKSHGKEKTLRKRAGRIWKSLSRRSD